MMIRRTPGILLLFLLACHFSAFAQRDKPGETKLDTTVADTIVVGQGSPTEGSTILEKTHLDTTTVAVPELGDTTAAVQAPVLRRLPDTTVYRWQHDPKFAYANDPEYWKTHREDPGSFWIWLDRVLRSKGFKYTILTLLGGLLLFAIIRIAMDNNLNLFYRRAKRTKADAGESAGLPEKEDLDQLLQHYLALGDKRQATRYLYLKSLHLLGDRNLIRWHADTTNQEYLLQLKGTPAEAAFRFLTGAYERVWYGEFELSDASFRRLHEYFTDFFKTLKA